MAAEAPEFLNGLAPWATTAYTIGAVAVASVLGGWAMFKSKSEEKAKALAEAAAPPEHFDADELLAAAPILKFLANIEELSVNARLIAEGVRNISAVATILGKGVEDEYDELRVWRAVDERFEKLMARRQGPPSGGWTGS